MYGYMNKNHIDNGVMNEFLRLEIKNLALMCVPKENIVISFTTRHNDNNDLDMTNLKNNIQRFYVFYKLDLYLR